MNRVARAFADPPPAPSHLSTALGSSDCQLALQLGGVTHYCVWEYPFRAPEAASAYEHLSTALGACLGNRATERDDLGVNHPDTFSSRQFDIDGISVTVSLKDKAALGKSLIFIRVMAPPGGH